MSKGSSRIPTFRSKGPQPKLPSHQSLSAKDIGRKVRVVDKEGILRYIGNVHFSSGIWCGIELKSSQGKNDGFVQGLRYFTCPPSCGLMAPLSKVTPADPYENLNLTIDDATSGPYSMLFLDPSEESLQDPQEATLVPGGDKTQPGCNTFSVAPNLVETPNNKTYDLQTDCKNDTFLVPVEDATTIINHKSSENLFRDSLEVKRRKFENATITGPEKPSSLPQLKSYQNFNSPEILFAFPNKLLSHSTPARSEFEETLFRKLQLSSNDDESSKRDSLEFEESLGILTPDQMVDGMSFMSFHSRTPSSECIGDLKDKDLGAVVPTPIPPVIKEDLPSPNTDFSLGIIDEQLLCNLTQRTDTTMNMELPLDSIGNNSKTLTRLEQTPSPEDLPLDPTPIVEISDTKTEPSNHSKSNKTCSSFITSITSITSLDTGYQGDGEMSRPASRGADNSPLTRRPLPRPQTRRPDPMTDSDFYTESDADNHEENVLRGDRRAQVIDGTLYGVDPQAAADIYVNNRENMDSSGIFTDIESSTARTEEDSPRPVNGNPTLDVSPSDTSTKTISSGNSQNNIEELLKKENRPGDEKVQKDNPKKRNASSPVTSSPPRHSSNKDDSAKKFKMPKREVVSKVKTMLESAPSKAASEKKNSPKKLAGRWDAVMNKISKTDSKTNLKDVKSKVFNNVNISSTQRQEIQAARKTPQKIVSQKTPSQKTRRVRTRTGNNITNINSSSPATNNHKSNVESSIHSSFSDLSAAGNTPKSSSIGSGKKREIVQVTQVLTASKLSPKTAQNVAENKKNLTISNNALQVESKLKKSPLLAGKEKNSKQANNSKECGRTTAKGGRASPVVRPPVLTRAPAKPVPRVAEALAVLVQHLVFNVEAYQVPVLKKEVQKFRHEAEEIRIACQRLEEALREERASKEKAVEDEKQKHKKQIDELTDKHKEDISELTKQQHDLERQLLEQADEIKTTLSRQNEDKLVTLRGEFQKLQKTHEESLDILREENDAIREQIDEKNGELEEVRHESLKLKKDYEAKEMKLKEQLHAAKNENLKLKQELGKTEEKLEGKLRCLQEDNARLREENYRLFDCSDNKEIGAQEVQSLRAVLELKQNEVSELRRTLAETMQKNEILQGAEEKAAALNARCEDLQHQLQRKSEYEQNLLVENKKLQDSFREEINQKKRLSQYNEELKWKLKQNQEVVTKVLEQAAEETSLNRSLLTASFNERHSKSPFKNTLERTLSFRDYKNDKSWRSGKNNEEVSPPTSPKVKGVVEKSDWVSYVLDLDESPDIVASRIVRRSFRNSTPPKTTPTKSPCSNNGTGSRRFRMKNPLSLSASASAIIPDKEEYTRSRSLSMRNGEVDVDTCGWASSTPKRDTAEEDLDLDEDEMDLKLPALPSELGRNNSQHQALPSPKHLAGEAMISESNSEDESTSSSSVQL